MRTSASSSSGLQGRHDRQPAHELRDHAEGHQVVGLALAEHLRGGRRIGRAVLFPTRSR